MENPFKSKKILIIIFAVFAGIVILFFGIDSNNSTVSKANNDNSLEYSSEQLSTYTDALEEKIKIFLESIGGISVVSVLVTVESSAETVYATNGTNSDYVIIRDKNGDENAIPLTEITARLRGIAVVCNYGNNEGLRLKIIDLLASLFDVGSNRISVISS